TGCGRGRRLGMPGLMIRALTPDQSMAAGSARRAPGATPPARAAWVSSHATDGVWGGSRARTRPRPEGARPRPTNEDPLSPPRSIIGSPQFQGGKAGQGQDGGDDPEAEDNGGLGPALLLEMVMQGRHAEDASAGPLVGQDLHDH